MSRKRALKMICDGRSYITNYFSLSSSAIIRVVIYSGTGDTRGYNATSIKNHAIFSTLFGTLLSQVHTGEPHASETIDLFWCPNFITSTVPMHHINEADWCGYKPVMFCVHLDQGREIRNPNKERHFLSWVWIIWSEGGLNLNLYILDAMRCSAEVKVVW
jgi:hypothetical protein